MHVARQNIGVRVAWKAAIWFLVPLMGFFPVGFVGGRQHSRHCAADGILDKDPQTSSKGFGESLGIVRLA